jgi:hypothetical protein
MNIAPNRAVAVLTPLVFAPLAGAVSVLIARYGVDIDGASLQAVFITGATIGFAKAGIWLKGWQEHEKRQADLALDAPHADLAEDDAAAEPDLAPAEDDAAAEPDLAPAEDDAAAEPDLAPAEDGEDDDEPDFEPELEADDDLPVPAGVEE